MLVRLGFRRAQYELQSTVVAWKRRAFSANINCSAQEYETSSNDKRRRCPLRKNGGGLPKQHDVSRGILAYRVQFEGGEISEGMVEARSAALWGHWVADVDRGAGLTVIGGGELSRVGETSP